MSGLHQEISFEDEVCDYLGRKGWLYALGDARAYDRTRALFPADLTAWVQETQPQAWEALIKSHGAQAEAATPWLADAWARVAADQASLLLTRRMDELLTAAKR